MRLVLALAAFGLFATSANAQSERIEKMNRVVDGLSSANPVIRLATLEEAIAGGDANLRNLAIQTALASDDPLLRSTALSGLFKNKRSFIVRVPVIDGDNRHAEFANDVIANRLEVFVANYDEADGSFKARSQWSRREEQNNQWSYRWEDGVFDGERVSFKVDMDQLSASFDGPCQGSAEGSSGSLVLTGQMACYQGSYPIEIDLLN